MAEQTPPPAPPPPVVEHGGPGAQKAAAVLLGLGPEVAGAVLPLLSEHELRRIALGAKELRGAPPSAVTDALENFVTTMETVGSETAAGDDLLREIAEKILGPEAARRIFEGVKPPPGAQEELGPAAQADPEALAMVLGREQPQTIALVLSSLEPMRAAGVMEKLAEKLRPEVLRRMASIESVAPDVLREVGHALSGELRSLVAGGLRRVDGKATALEILRRQPPQAQGVVLSDIEKDDQQLASELRSRLFTFGDLGVLADRDLQTLLREIDASRLTVALKGSTAELRDKFLRNLSSRAAEMLQDDLAAMGPVKLSSVETAQQEIAKLAQELAQQGRITIVNPTEKML